MMYRMKKIVHLSEEIPLSNCMYTLKTINYIENDCVGDEIDLNIGKQVKKFLQAPNPAMADLERRQDELLKKLDILYERVQNISAICKTSQNSSASAKPQSAIALPNEIVLVTSPDNLPWFINIIGKKITDVNLSWHIHSSVPNEKVLKIKAFVDKLPVHAASKTTIRLIFKNVSADAELKLSSLDVPFVGTVNILRYLSFVYPSIVPYEEHYTVDSLLDVCHLLERASEKNKDALIKKLFSQYDEWIYNKSFSIVDLAAYNVVKQWRSSPKSVPKEWIERCEKL